MRNRLLPRCAAAVAAAALVATSSAASSPLGSLTPIVKHFEKGLAAYLAGTSASEAFAPWKADDASAERAREALKTAKAASARAFSTALEMYFVKEGTTETNMVVSVWLGGRRRPCSASSEGSRSAIR